MARDSQMLLRYKYPDTGGHDAMTEQRCASSGQGASGAYLAGGYSQYSGYDGGCKKYCTKIMSGGRNLPISIFMSVLLLFSHLLEKHIWEKESRQENLLLIEICYPTLTRLLCHVFLEFR